MLTKTSWKQYHLTLSFIYLGRAFLVCGLKRRRNVSFPVGSIVQGEYYSLPHNIHSLHDRLICETIRNLKTPPKTFVSASGVGYYGSNTPSPVTETSPMGAGFLAQLSRDWEEASASLKQRYASSIRSPSEHWESVQLGLFKRESVLSCQQKEECFKACTYHLN